MSSFFGHASERLHDYLPSLNGWKVRVPLGLLRIPYQTEPVAIFAGANRTETFLAMNPVGAIPVLELEDDRTLAESNAILTYLAADTVSARGQVLSFQGHAVALLRAVLRRAYDWLASVLDCDRQARALSLHTQPRAVVRGSAG